MSELIVEYNDVEIQLESELIIKGLNIKINKGEFVYMIGKTGSGKSSILKSMYSEKKIISGKAIVSNVNLNSIRDNKIPILRRKIGIVLAWVIGCIGALIVSFLYQNYYVVGLGFFLMGFGVNPAITLQFSFFNEHSSNNFKYCRFSY